MLKIHGFRTDDLNTGMRYEEIDCAAARGLRETLGTSDAAKATKLHAKQTDAQHDRADAAHDYQQSLQRAQTSTDPTRRSQRRSDASQAYQRKLQRANNKQTAATAALMRLK